MAIQGQRTAKIISWLCQIIAGSIFAFAAYQKFHGGEGSTFVFDAIKMGHTGRVLVGILEAICFLLLISPTIPHYGAILGSGIMLGAIIAHFTHLGFEVNGDGGQTVLMLVTTFSSCLLILYVHRKRLPLIGFLL